MTERNVCLTIPFESSQSATLAYEVLIIDKDHKRSEVQREVTAEEENLIVKLHGTDLKRLRAALNSTLKNILLIAKTTDMFRNSN